MSSGEEHIREEDIRREFTTIKSGISLGGALTLLHIGSEHTILASGNELPVVTFLNVGAEKTGSKFFRHTPPTPDEIEYAINEIENEIQRMHDLVTTGSELYTKDRSVGEIAHLAGVDSGDEIVLSRNAMEALFSRVAALSLGRSPALDDVKVDAVFVSRLLILREVMFHLDFQNIIILI
jgi:exopolyphosphatase/pppGpp-phosphohydrolase